MADRVFASGVEETVAVAAGSSAAPSGSAASASIAEYTRRAAAREAQGAAWEARHVRLGYVRLALVAAVLAAVWFGFVEGEWPRWVVALPVVIFAAVAVYHSRVLRERAKALRAAEVYRRGLARIQDRWQGANARDVRPEFVAGLFGAEFYASDLDIVGRDGLFELLCAARTRMGEEMLLRWLLEPVAHAEIGARAETGVQRGPKSTLGEIRARQQAVAELRGRLDFREAMAVAGDTAKVGVRAEALLKWAEGPDVLRQRWWPWLAGLLAAMAVAALGVWIAWGMVAPLFVVLVVEAGARLPLKREMAAVLDGSSEALENMQLLAALLERLEAETFESERLREIMRKLAALKVSEHGAAGREVAGGGVAASGAIARLGTLAQYRYSMDNPIVRVLNLPLLYGVQLAFAVQRWRRRHGPAVRQWLAAVGEMEALLSLAAYSYEHPGDPFPVLAEGEACFEAVEMGHPLIAAERCVRNSVRIGGETRVLLVSGSNMSGKSTLMRAVGVNAVLAMCGAPVRARSLRMSPLRVGASLLVNDSLQSGQSRFYVEIERLSRICRLAEEQGAAGLGVLFLLDELLQGTNSKDRLVGAKGVIGALVRAGAIGVATTHDLALTKVEELESGAVKNMHFQDEIVEGQMRFDFRLREGVVARSNGVELMRLIGLKV